MKIIKLLNEASINDLIRKFEKESTITNPNSIRHYIDQYKEMKDRNMWPKDKKLTKTMIKNNHHVL